MVEPGPDVSGQRLYEAAWPDMFANLQTAYAELTRAQFELEQRAAEVEEARDLFQQVVQSMGEALFLLDHAGRVVRTNAAAGALLDSEETDLPGKPFVEICQTRDIP